jgi:antitoxin YefM
MHAVSYSEARENLKAMSDKAVADRAPLAITRQRGEGAVLVSESEWASIEETLYLLRSPKNAERLLGAVREGGQARAAWPQSVRLVVAADNLEHRLVYRVTGSGKTRRCRWRSTGIIIELSIVSPELPCHVRK